MPKTFESIQKEVSQHHSLRTPLIEDIQKWRQHRCVISFFISFYSKDGLSQEDADMIEEVLCNSDTSKGVTLILDAPGGDGLAAERIIQLCRKYSGKDFETIVPSRGKSAATMVCLGSDRILMGATSELGPIDPQIAWKIGESWRWVAAYYVIQTYDELMAKAVALKEGHIEPFLQQLSQFNATQIEMFRSATKLSESIAISSLKRGMLKDKSLSLIKKKIKCFTDPNITLSHGRALDVEHISECQLNIEQIDLKTDEWKTIRDLYSRSKFVVDRGESGRKLLETTTSSYQAA